MVTLFSSDRPNENLMEWYTDRKLRCIQQMWDVTCELLNIGTSVILELGLVQAVDRQNFYNRVDCTDHGMQVYLIEAPIEIRRQRVLERNTMKTDTYKMEVSDEIFILANSLWQKPTEIEIKERDIEIISTV